MYNQIVKLIDELGDRLFVQKEFGGLLRYSSTMKEAGLTVFQRAKLKHEVKKQLKVLFKELQDDYEIRFDGKKFDYPSPKAFTIPIITKNADVEAGTAKNKLIAGIKDYAHELSVYEKTIKIFEDIPLSENLDLMAKRVTEAKKQPSRKPIVTISKILVRYDIHDKKGIVVEISNDKLNRTVDALDYPKKVRTTEEEEKSKKKYEEYFSTPKSLRWQRANNLKFSFEESAVMQKLHKSFISYGIDGLDNLDYLYLVRACKLDETTLSMEEICAKLTTEVLESSFNREKYGFVMEYAEVMRLLNITRSRPTTYAKAFAYQNAPRVSNFV